jgi:hypothetical protein
MADILAMLYRLMDQQGPYANAIYIFTNTMQGDVAKIEDDDHNSLIKGTYVS